MKWFWQRKRKHFGVFSTVIVPTFADFPNRTEKADEIKKWLVEIKAIKPEISFCTYYENTNGYAIDKGAKKLSEFPEKLPFKNKINGLEIVTQQTIFDAGDSGLDRVICPACQKNIFGHFEAHENFRQHGISKVKCPECKVENEINDFHYTPTWAFSNLGFVFWNWRDFTPAFIEEFEKRLGCKVKIVECPQET